MTAGYGSHLIADMVTLSGLPILWPLYGEPLHLLPRGLRITTGGCIEWLIWFGVIALTVYYFASPTALYVTQAASHLLKR